MSQVYGISSNPEKPKKPVLELAGTSIDILEWEAFVNKLSFCKSPSGLAYKVIRGFSCTRKANLIFISDFSER